MSGIHLEPSGSSSCLKPGTCISLHRNDRSETEVPLLLNDGWRALDASHHMSRALGGVTWKLIREFLHLSSGGGELGGGQWRWRWRFGNAQGGGRILVEFRLLKGVSGAGGVVLQSAAAGRSPAKSSLMA